jgi:hypothetical protein
VQPDDQLKQHALAGAAAPQYGERFSFSDFQINALQNRLFAEGLTEGFHLNGWCVLLEVGVGICVQHVRR